MMMTIVHINYNSLIFTNSQPQWEQLISNTNLVPISPHQNEKPLIQTPIPLQHRNHPFNIHQSEILFYNNINTIPQITPPFLPTRPITPLNSEITIRPASHSIQTNRHLISHSHLHIF